MSNIKYGLALGGGAARGFAHIGLIKYLEKQKIEISEVSGTSMGSIIAACLAVGKNSDDMKKISSEINFLKLIDFDLKKGIVKGEKIFKKLFEIFGDKKIEDCEISLKIVASDLDLGEKVVFEKGRIVDAIRASVGIPGVISPFEFEGKKLIDGGILNNLPVDVLESENIIACSVLLDLKREVSFKKNILGIDFDKWIFTNSYSILQKTIDIMMAQNEKNSVNIGKNSGKNIILLNPKFEGIDYWEFHKFEEIIEIGYDFFKKFFLLL